MMLRYPSYGSWMRVLMMGAANASRYSTDATNMGVEERSSHAARFFSPRYLLSVRNRRVRGARRGGSVTVRVTVRMVVVCVSGSPASIISAASSGLP